MKGPVGSEEASAARPTRSMEVSRSYTRTGRWCLVVQLWRDQVRRRLHLPLSRQCGHARSPQGAPRSRRQRTERAAICPPFRRRVSEARPLAPRRPLVAALEQPTANCRCNETPSTASVGSACSLWVTSSMTSRTQTRRRRPTATLSRASTPQRWSWCRTHAHATCMRVRHERRSHTRRS